MRALISARLKELTIREKVKKTSCLDMALDSWIDNWVKEGFHPQTLKIVSNALYFTSKINSILD